MSKGYWIARVDITDLEKYQTYIAANAEPLKKYGARFLVRGGREIGSLDVGYGPARAFGAAEVRAIDAALGGVGDDELRARFDPARMKALEIYPDIWDPDDHEPVDYVMENVAGLRRFLAAAVARDLGVVISLT